MLAILPSSVLSSFLAGSQRSSVATSPSRLDSPSDRSRRFTAVGESATFFTQVERSWSVTFAKSTSRTAMAPAAAARRSSYAARRQAWEHHLRGRPLGLPTHGVPQRRQVPCGAAAAGASPVVRSVMKSEATNVRTKRTSRQCMGCEGGEGGSRFSARVPCCGGYRSGVNVRMGMVEVASCLSRVAVDAVASRSRKGWSPVGTVAQAQAARDQARGRRLKAATERRLRLDPDQMAREERIDEAAIDVLVAWENGQRPSGPSPTQRSRPEPRSNGSSPNGLQSRT